jgi:plastocyanin
LILALVIVPSACGSEDLARNDGAAQSTNEVDTTIAAGWRSDNLPGVGSVLGSQSATYEFFIPEGASDRLAAGEDLDIVPGRFAAKVGESVKIVNHDRRGHNVGLWYVGPGETVIQKFTSAGTYQGLCTVHPTGALVVEVTEA